MGLANDTPRTGRNLSSIDRSVLAMTTFVLVPGFWLGAWDPDLLSAYFVGALDAPYAPG